MDAFDPYHIWLAIPPEKQPPNHYELLGIPPFESNTDVIAYAADQRMGHLRNLATGKYSELSQKLLNEVAAAKVCLLNEQNKSAYDAELRATQNSTSTELRETDVAPPPKVVSAEFESSAPEIQTTGSTTRETLATRVTAPRSTRKSRQRERTVLLYSLLVVFVTFGGLVGVLVLLNRGTGRPEPAPGPDWQTSDFEVGNVSVDPLEVPKAGGGRRSGELFTIPKYDEPPTPPADLDDEAGTPVEPEPEPADQPDEEPSPAPPIAKEISTSPPRKLPVPDETTQIAKLEFVREVYKTDEVRTKEQRANLAKTLLQDGIAARNDTAGQYVLLHAAKDTAAKIGDVDTAFGAIAEISRDYDVDGLKMKAAALTDAAEELESASDHQQLVSRIMALVREAVAADQYDLARQVRKIASSSARKARGTDLSERVQSRYEEIEEIENAYGGVTDALTVLESQPTDPDCNLIVGKFRCFVKGDWSTGIQMLAHSNDAALKELAEMELAEKSDVIALGDKWWDLSEAMETSVKRKLQAHAAECYRKGLPGLRGSERTEVTTRLEEVSKSGIVAIPADAAEFRGHYYKFIDTHAMTWHVAQEYCRKLGGHLARIESEAEHDFVAQLIKGHDLGIFIDGNDEFAEGVWRFSDGRPISFNKMAARTAESRIDTRAFISV